MKLFIAREAVDVHLAVAGDIIDPNKDGRAKTRAAARATGFYATWLPKLAVGKGQVPGAFGEFGPLATHLRFVERQARKLARSTFWGMSRWQGGLEKRQSFLGRLVDIGAELFAMAAAVTRAQMLVADQDEDATLAVELADLFCVGARRRVDRLFHELWANDDAAEYKAAQRVLAGRYLFAEKGLLDRDGSQPGADPSGDAAEPSAGSGHEPAPEAPDAVSTGAPDAAPDAVSTGAPDAAPDAVSTGAPDAAPPAAPNGASQAAPPGASTGAPSGAPLGNPVAGTDADPAGTTTGGSA